MQFENITKLALFVDVPNRAVIGTVIGAAPEDQPSVKAVAEALTSDHRVKLTDAETGTLVYDGRVEDMGDKCAPGTADG